MTTGRRIMCRSCGDWGYEEVDDPCPGLCPGCFNAGLAAETVALEADAADPTLTRQDVSRRHGERLRALGMPRAHVERVLAEEQHLLATRREP